LTASRSRANVHLDTRGIWMPQLKRKPVRCTSPVNHEVNLLTLEPRLALMLAEAGLAVGGCSLGDVWPVFLEFLEVPSPYPDDRASVQTETETEVDIYRYVRLTREITDPETHEARVVVVEFFYSDIEPDGHELDVWSDKFSTIGAFAAHAEMQPAFEWALQQDDWFVSTLYSVDPATGDEEVIHPDGSDDT